MPYKDPEVRRIKAREYTRAYKARLSPEKKAEINARRRTDAKEQRLTWLQSLSPEDRRAYYDETNRMRREEYAGDPKHRERISKGSYRRYHEKRNAVLAHLGGRCVSPDCKWINENGTRGCTDKLCLQIDHVHGDGKKRRQTIEKNTQSLYLAVLASKPGEIYQLLCANCNWIKRWNNKEVPKSRFAKAAVA